ncbi:EF-hand protein [Geopyxis carbonaria]|nr:EF-hand protein [Geopyxis carbonaria]
MPPKRTSLVSKKKAGSKLAQELDITPDEESEIREAWEIFVDEAASEEAGEEAIKRSDVRKVFMALGLESSRQELQEILETIDPENEGLVVYRKFVEVAALKFRYRDTKEEVEKAYHLFTNGSDGPIRLADLRRVADSLKEDVTDEQLKDMLSEASTRDVGRGVDIHDFESIMKRAGLL